MKTPSIPNWTGEEALSVAAFLSRLVDAIWARHGPRMARALHSAHLDSEEEEDDYAEPHTPPSRLHDLPF